jgi:hypothetical protein
LRKVIIYVTVRATLKCVKDNVEFGKVTEPCPCCDPKLNIHTIHGGHKYVITADCSQCGICCRDGWGKCYEAVFAIHKSNKGKDLMTLKNADGIIYKRFGGIKEIVSDANNYEVNFPDDASPEEKLIIIGAVIRTDYLYFEKKGKNC